MSNESDELAAIIKSPESFDGGPVSCGPNDVYAARTADAILAAGYTRPRQVTTVEELDALPVGSVLILRDAKHEPHPAQKGEHGWRLPFVDAFWTSERILAGCESAEVVSGE